MDHNLRSLYVDVLVHGFGIRVHSKYDNMTVVIGWKSHAGSGFVVKYYALTQDSKSISDANWDHLIKSSGFEFCVARTTSGS